MNPTTGRVSQKMIAAEARVSRMTVSLALRNHPSLPPATCKRIQRIAATLDYRPDPQLARLMEDIRTQRTRGPEAIGYITANRARWGWRDDQPMLEYYDGVQRHAEANGFRLEHFWSREPGMTDARLSGILRSRGIRGIIIAPLPEPAERYGEFAWDDFSAVALGYSIVNLVQHRACHHHFLSILTLVDRLLEIGYRRPALAMRESEDARVNHRWSGGFHVAQRVHGTATAIPPLLPVTLSRAEFVAWLSAHDPDVVITSPLDALTVQAWLAELRPKASARAGLASVHLHPGLRGITGVNQNSFALAAAAVDLLVALMRHNQRGIPTAPRTIMVDGSIVLAQSTRSPGSLASHGATRASHARRNASPSPPGNRAARG